MKNYLKSTIIYEWIRKRKAVKLDNEYNNLLNTIANAPPDNYTINAPSVKLANGEKPVILGVGHQDWEKYGFWNAIENQSNFSFFQVQSNIKLLSAAYQTQITTDVKKKVNDVKKLFGKIDIVFFYCDASYLSVDLLTYLKEQGIFLILMGLDDKHKFKIRKVGEVTGGQQFVIPYVDLYWTTWKSLIPVINSLGTKAIYMAEGADPDFHRNFACKKDIDVLFLGSAYGERKRIIDFLIANGVNVTAYGDGWQNGFVTFEETIDLYNRSKIVLGVGGVGHSLNFKHLKGRDFEATMCGCFYLTSYNPELADWFTIGKEIVCYSSDLEMLELINYYLKNDAERETIAGNALKKSLNDHTWQKRIKTLLQNIYEPS